MQTATRLAIGFTATALLAATVWGCQGPAGPPGPPGPPGPAGGTLSIYQRSVDAIGSGR